MNHVMIREFSNEFEADLAASFLRSAGIPVEIVNPANAAISAGYLMPCSQVELKVLEADLERARALLDQDSPFGQGELHPPDP